MESSAISAKAFLATLGGQEAFWNLFLLGFLFMWTVISI